MSAIRWFIVGVGLLVTLFGLGCLNYTKIGGVDHHRKVAEERGWPVPSVAIAHIGMLSTTVGAGMLGWGLGRGRAKTITSRRRRLTHMCGRYTLRTPPAVLVEHFRLGSIPEITPRYNVAPTYENRIRRQTNGARMRGRSCREKSGRGRLARVWELRPGPRCRA